MLNSPYSLPRSLHKCIQWYDCTCIIKKNLLVGQMCVTQLHLHQYRTIAFSTGNDCEIIQRTTFNQHAHTNVLFYPSLDSRLIVQKCRKAVAGHN